MSAVDPVVALAAGQGIATLGSEQHASPCDGRIDRVVIRDALIERSRIPRRAVIEFDLHSACRGGIVPAGKADLRASACDVEHERIAIAPSPDIVWRYRRIKADFLGRSRGR